MKVQVPNLINLVTRHCTFIFISYMLKIIIDSPLSPLIVGIVSILYSAYWLFLSSDEFWRNAIGVYNIVFLCFYIALGTVALLLLASGNTKFYTIFSFISFIPAIIVCFINRYSRYPDFQSIASQYLIDNSAEPVSTYMNSTYDTAWKMYDFIVSRSGKASSSLGVLVIAWAALLLYPSVSYKSKNVYK